LRHKTLILQVRRHLERLAPLCISGQHLPPHSQNRRNSLGVRRHQKHLVNQVRDNFTVVIGLCHEQGYELHVEGKVLLGAHFDYLLKLLLVAALSQQALDVVQQASVLVLRLLELMDNARDLPVLHLLLLSGLNTNLLVVEEGLNQRLCVYTVLHIN
jgi:hypothetical protein